MELIDRNELGSPIYISGYGEAYDANTIEYADTVDAVPVVRCGECRHEQKVEGGISYCEALGIGCIEWCSRGEPRTPPAE